MLLLMALASAAVSGSIASAAARQTDFNGDGRADLAIGVPNETVAGFEGAGAVYIIYGKNSNGLNADGAQVWTQESPGVQGAAAEDEIFGQSLAVGDFDGDGFSDLAIGVPFDEVDGVDNAGAVHVLYGSSSGLRASGDQYWHRAVAGVQGDPNPNADFGSPLAAGDFNNDGRDDLAIGVTHEPLGAVVDAGEVHVLYGSSNGLTAAGDQVFNQDTTGIHDFPEEGDRFGNALGVGDFDADGRDDLAINALDDRVGALAVPAGAVHILYGTSQGLDVDGTQYFTQDTSGIADDAEEGDRFGGVLAAGDFDNDGRDDLAIGVSNEDIGSDENAGAVHVLYGRASGLSATDADFWTQDSPGIPDGTEEGDQFGTGLAAGDFDNDGHDDLAIGADGEEVGGHLAAGVVHVLYGGNNGLTASGDQFWHQDVGGIRESAAEDDRFGSELAAGDYDNDGRDDLAIGVSSEDIGAVDDAGAVNVIYGGSSGLLSGGNQLWHQDSGIGGSPGDFDAFGSALR